MRKGKVEKLASTIEKILDDRGWGAKLKEYRVFSIWAKAVGPGIARHSQPASIRGRRLTVVVDSSAWMQQLSMLKPDIIAKVNSRLGPDGIESITLKLGELDAAFAPVDLDEAPPAGKLDAADEGKIVAYLADIKDEETRAAFRKVMEQDLLSKKRKGK